MRLKNKFIAILLSLSTVVFPSFNLKASEEGFPTINTSRKKTTSKNEIRNNGISTLKFYAIAGAAIATATGVDHLCKNIELNPYRFYSRDRLTKEFSELLVKYLLQIRDHALVYTPNIAYYYYNSDYFNAHGRDPNYGNRETARKLVEYAEKYYESLGATLEEENEAKFMNYFFSTSDEVSPRHNSPLRPWKKWWGEWHLHQNFSSSLFDFAGDSMSSVKVFFVPSTYPLEHLFFYDLNTINTRGYGVPSTDKWEVFEYPLKPENIVKFCVEFYKREFVQKTHSEEILRNFMTEMYQEILLLYSLVREKAKDRYVPMSEKLYDSILRDVKSGIS